MLLALETGSFSISVSIELKIFWTIWSLEHRMSPCLSTETDKTRSHVSQIQFWAPSPVMFYYTPYWPILQLLKLIRLISLMYFVSSNCFHLLLLYFKIRVEQRSAKDFTANMESPAAWLTTEVLWANLFRTFRLIWASRLRVFHLFCCFGLSRWCYIILYPFPQ